MKRRHFLQTSGLAIAGGTAAIAGTAQPDAETARVRGAADWRVLVTTAADRWARGLADGLAGRYRASRLEQTLGDVASGPDRSPLASIDTAQPLVRGIDVVVHAAHALANDDEAVRLDYCTQGTYNLLSAAVAEGVRRVVYLSTLDMLADYDASFEVTEDWSPVAKPGGGLAEYLGECVCREFARARTLQLVVLRLGRVTPEGTRAGAGPVAEAAARRTDPRDLLEAVVRTLETLRDPASKLGAWSVFHIVSPSAATRFSIAKARRELGYKPRSGAARPEAKP